MSVSGPISPWPLCTNDIPRVAALAYAARGWRVFPLAPRSKVPATAHGYHDASSDGRTVAGWWDRCAAFGIGVACADSGLIALDIDPRNDGDHTLEDLEQRLGPLPETVSATTGGGGRHLLFALPPGLSSARSHLGPGVDVKLHGYIVLSPSIHPSGERYRWLVSPDIQQPVALPTSWIAELQATQAAPRTTGETRPRIHTGESTHYGLAALESECQRVKSAPTGQRNNLLNQAAFAIGQLEAGGEVDTADARLALDEAASACGLSDTEARRTIESGCRAGRLNPRSAPRDHHRVSDSPPPIDTDESLEVEGEPAWSGSLTFRATDKGDNIIENTPGNLALILTHSRGWIGTLVHDELYQQASWIGTPPQIDGFLSPSGRVTDEHITYIRQWAARYYRVKWSAQSACEAVALAASQIRYHPVQRYLESQIWDGEPRVGTWIHRYFAEASPSDVPVAGWWLISAVARAMRPGSKVDHMLILEGPQGAGKSTAASILGGEWASASLGDVRDKDAHQSLAGVWIMEIPELDAMRRADATRTKTFLSLTTDHFRPSYGRMFVWRPRSCVFLGTTNESRYLHDPSGARRYWPIRVSDLDADALHRDRDQLWAEAYLLYREGARWWPIGITECETLADQVEERYAQDPWEPILADLMSSSTETWMVSRLLSGPLGVDVAHQDRSAAQRIGTIMSRLDGVTMTRRRVAGVRCAVYRGRSALREIA